MLSFVQGVVAAATTARGSSPARERAWEFVREQLEQGMDLFGISCPYKQPPTFWGAPSQGSLQGGCWWLLGPTDPSARWVWKTPSPNSLILRSRRRFQRVPKWVAISSGWVGARPEEALDSLWDSVLVEGWAG